MIKPLSQFKKDLRKQINYRSQKSCSTCKYRDYDEWDELCICRITFSSVSETGICYNHDSDRWWIK